MSGGIDSSIGNTAAYVMSIRRHHGLRSLLLGQISAEYLKSRVQLSGVAKGCKMGGVQEIALNWRIGEVRSYLEQLSHSP